MKSTCRQPAETRIVHAVVNRLAATAIAVAVGVPISGVHAQSQPDPRLLAPVSDADNGVKPVVVDVHEDAQSGNMVLNINGGEVNTRDWVAVEKAAQRAYPGRIVQFRFENGQTHIMPRTMLGVILEPIDGVAASQLRIQPGNAVVVDSVIEGMPAADAGIRQFDVILSCNGEEPVTKSKFTQILISSAPGDHLSLVLLREGSEVELPVTLKRYDPELVRRAGGQDLSQITYRMAAPPRADGAPDQAGARSWADQSIGSDDIDQLIARLAEDNQLMQFEVLPRGPSDLQDRMTMMHAPTNNVSEELREIRVRLDRMEKALEMLLQSQFGDQQPANRPSRRDRD